MSSPLPPHLDPRPRHRNAHRGAGSVVHAAQPIWRTVGAIISIALLVAAGYYWWTYRGINNGITRLQVDLRAAPSGSKTDFDPKDQNILLVGNDDRSNLTQAERRTLHVGSDGGSQNTDTMMIVHVPANGSKATLISLPRDSYVDIPGYGMGRLNSAYVDGYNNVKAGSSHQDRQTAGANLLLETIRNLTGLTINHYVQISLLGFYDISNAIGGVPIVLCHNVDDSVARNEAVYGSGGSGFKMSKGRHVIKGVTALEFVRQRHFLPGGDLDRVRRQQYFLAAAFRQAASVGILTKLNALGSALKRDVYLDPGLNLLDLAHQMENLSANNIIGKTIPTTPETIDGQDVLMVSPVQVKSFIKNIIAPTPATPATSHPASSTSAPAKATTAPKALDQKCVN